MADDLGRGGREVHAAAAAILSFWFDELTDGQHFVKDASLDTEIERRFGELRDRILATRAEGWRDEAETLLAAVIALDQFSRNIHRDSPRAFEADPLALSLAREAIARGWDDALDPRRRAFLYMPFMHAEDPGAQAECVALFAALGDAEQLAYAKGHRELIDRFGRFPHRNAALGRHSSEEERDWLSQPGAGY